LGGCAELCKLLDQHLVGDAMQAVCARVSLTANKHM